jgi:TatD DNase family protein
MLDLIDSHSHFDVADFDADRDAVLAHARECGVRRQIVAGIARDGFEKLRDLCAANEGLYATYGLHPLFLAQHKPEHLDELEVWIDREHPVAVGECGLDFYVEGLDVDEQRRYLERQLVMARDRDLPVILHARRAFDDVAATIRRIGSLRGVVHSFSGSQEQANQLWKLGFHIGIGGPVTYERAHRLRGIVRDMPLEFLLLETDSPDQPLFGHQGHRNEPAMLVDICRTIAELRDADPADIARATTQNCERLFALN